MRLVYNTTFIIQEEIESEWIEFMKEHYISPLQENRVTIDILFSKVSIDQPDGKTYSLQLIFDSEDKMNLFVSQHLPHIEKKIITHYKNRYLCFSSQLYEL
ncbi:DUF4286 family protein [Odoribacter sp. OttesenSCG-928-G04]|nr:DUF4286 family protein [Odoribacter sp. OttesenSCG-928-G04]MDL2330595.1 DUF4286 family protein [Odoribacter sp. OttesenSCG-928-A06]